MAGQTPDWLRDAFEYGQGIGDPGDALGQQRERDAQQRLDEQYKQMHQAFQQYRPEHMQSRMNALNQQLGAFGPMNDLIQRMYGGGAGFDLAALGKNPMTAGAMMAGQQSPGTAEQGDGGIGLPFGLDPQYALLGAVHGPEAFLTQPVANALRSTREGDPWRGEVSPGLGYGAPGTPPAQPKENPDYTPTYGFSTGRR